MVYCDNNPNILEWGSEEIIIPYKSPLDKKVHEVKPKRHLSPPKEPKRKTKRYLGEVNTYIINQAKFKAAEEFCKDRKLGFRILTEEHLVPKK